MNLNDNVKVVNNTDVTNISNNKLSNLSYKEKDKLDKIYNKYKIKNRLIIERVARKTVRYIEKNTINFPKEYKVLRDKIIDSSYTLLENIMRANIFQEVEYKKEIIVQIQILNFYLEEAYIKNILTEKKLISYTNHLIEIDKMVKSWFSYEKSK